MSFRSTLEMLDFFGKAWYNNKAVGRESEARRSGKHATLGKLNSLKCFEKSLIEKNIKRNFEKIS